MHLLIFIVIPIILKFNKVNCVDFNNSSSINCTCVPFNQCLDEDIERDGAGLLDVRIFEKGPCSGHFDICCNNTTSLAESVSEKPTKGCGYQNSGFFPWSASLLHKKTKKSEYNHKCGVSLINKKAVITAAHCFDKETNGFWAIRLGKIMRIPKKVIIHPLYDQESLHNDIAIIILSSVVPNIKKISTICIPPHGIVLEQNISCSSPTWIKLHSNNNKSYSYLTLSKPQIIPREICLKLLRNTRLGSMFQLHHGFICAYNSENEDTSCDGNGGSPLVCPIPGQPGRYHQIGILSWGIECGNNKIPGVFVNLETFRDWIDHELTKNDLDINSYRY